jgi:two-component system KDP operon response regulator KdpE
LIVDDDPRFLRVLHLALSSYGYDVTDAADGKEALDAIANEAPDLMVLDWQMPGMDGLQTCRLLRLSSAMPVIMISGNRSNSHEGALNGGANDYLAKPFSINDLLTRIETSLKF